MSKIMWGVEMDMETIMRERLLQIIVDSAPPQETQDIHATVTKVTSRGGVEPARAEEAQE